MFILISLLALVLAVYLYYKKQFNYWKDRNVPHLEPQFPLGNFQTPFASVTEFIHQYYQIFKKKGVDHAGMYAFASPMYIPMRPDLVKDILIKDFASFMNRGIYSNEKDDPLAGNLFLAEGERWKVMRHKLSPTFTSGKMKMMFHIIHECSQVYTKQFEGKNEVDIKEISGRFTTDVISSCAFGLDCDSMVNPDNQFRKYGKQAFRGGTLIHIKRVFANTLPKLARKLRLVPQSKEVREFFVKVCTDNMKYRKENNVRRNDFFQLLIDMVDDDKISFDQKDIVPQTFVFFLAGFETSSSAITYTLFELAKNQVVQQRARDEINKVLAGHNGQITYEAIMDMKYLQQVIDEALRMYPAAQLMRRDCNKDHQLGELLIEAGTKVMIPVYSMHWDADYFPEPERFDPERFSDENKSRIPDGVYLPFGEGPRICIGMRFGLMQVKVGLVSLLTKYKFTLSDKTPERLTIDRTSLVLSTNEVIYLKPEKI